METRGLIAIKSHKGFLFASGTPEKLLEFQLGELKLSSRRYAHVKGSKIRRRKKTVLALLPSWYRSNPRDISWTPKYWNKWFFEHWKFEEWKRLVCYRVVTQLIFQMVTVFLVLVWGFCLLKPGALQKILVFLF